MVVLSKHEAKAASSEFEKATQRSELLGKVEHSTDVSIHIIRED